MQIHCVVAKYLCNIKKTNLNYINMQLTAKIDQVLAPVTGESKNGKWKKQDIIVETISNYPKKVCLTLWGEKIDTSHLKIGATVNFHIELESKDNNGKWFTNIKVWKIESVGNTFPVDNKSVDPFDNIESITPFDILSAPKEEILPF